MSIMCLFIQEGSGNTLHPPKPSGKQKYSPCENLQWLNPLPLVKGCKHPSRDVYVLHRGHLVQGRCFNNFSCQLACLASFHDHEHKYLCKKTPCVTCNIPPNTYVNEWNQIASICAYAADHKTCQY